MQTVLPNIASWQALATAVRTGTSTFEAVNGIASWDFYASHPDEAATFNAAMARRSVLQFDAVRAGCDFGGVSTLVDVGGGKGAMLARILSDHTQLSGVVADLPHVAAEADRALAAAGLGNRGHGVGASFFESVPAGYDGYLISNVLHDWGDDKCLAILSSVRKAMKPDSRLWIVEVVLDTPGRTFEQSRDLHLVDLHMLVMFGGRERTSAEYDALLVAAGFGPGVLADTRTLWNVIEARPV